MGSSSAPDYPTTKVSSDGLYGSSTTNANGTTYSPTDFEKQFATAGQTGALNALNGYLNPTASSDLVDSYNNQYTQDYNNNYLNPALSKGLLRGSTAADVMRGAETDYKNNRSSLIDAERNRQLGNLQTSLLAYTTPYDMMKGTSGLSQSLANSVGNYNAQTYAADQATKAAMYSALGNAVGTAGGGYLGGLSKAGSQTGTTKI